MKSRWLAKIAAIVCALCLAMGVMSQSVFARDDAQEKAAYVAEEPEATFVVLSGERDEATPEPEVTDNRTTLPVYAHEELVGQCAMIGGEPYMSVTGFCRALELDAQIIDNGSAVSMAMDGLVMTAQMGQAYFNCNDRYIYLENGPQTVDGTVALPVEDLVKCMGLTAYWDRVNWDLTVDGTEVKPLTSGGEFYDEADVFWLSRLIYALAAEQPLEAQVAVGSVCVNRIGNARFAGQDNIYEVIFAKNQFSVVTNGMIYVQPDETSVLAAKLALDGCDVAGGADYVARNDMGEGYEQVAAFGDLRFYREA